MKKTTDKGFTLVEVLIALTILSIGILGIAGLAGTAIKSSSYARSLTQATNFGQERLEALMGVEYNNIQSSETTGPSDLMRTCVGPTGVNNNIYTCTPTTPTKTIGNTVYTWSYIVTYIDLDGNGIISPYVDGIKRVDLTVSWTDMLWYTQKSVKFVTLRTRG
ncbi:MAG: prepilin-type N-terminal cleavage/methylation domain-containing protein [Deltaproteobacteria bacterium]|nr:prepilin-type N-terminal cleavage/methylation domain-containing protein [Deltaproteobacteria bacterium]